MKTLLGLAFVSALALGAEPSPLDQTVGPLRFEKAPLPAALRALGRAAAHAYAAVAMHAVRGGPRR